jgi:hypothetical protein
MGKMPEKKGGQIRIGLQGRLQSLLRESHIGGEHPGLEKDGPPAIGLRKGFRIELLKTQLSDPGASITGRKRGKGGLGGEKLEECHVTVEALGSGGSGKGGSPSHKEKNKKQQDETPGHFTARHEIRHYRR